MGVGPGDRHPGDLTGPVGGRAEQVTIEVYPERLAGFGLSLAQVAGAITSTNVEQQMGGVESGGSHMMVVSGDFLEGVEDIKRLQVGSHNGMPVYVQDSLKVLDLTRDVPHIMFMASPDLDEASFQFSNRQEFCGNLFTELMREDQIYANFT